MSQWRTVGQSIVIFAHGLPSKQVHSAAIRGRPSGRPACF